MNEPFSAPERMENTLKSVQEAQTPLLRVNLFSDAIPERFRLECLNNRTLAAMQLNEMEEAIACLEAGKQGARDLESKQRRAEVDYAYREIYKLWSAETRVHVLGDSLDGDGK